VRLLIKHPDLVKVEVFSNWFVFFPHQQFDMLCAHKEFSQYCIWESFNKNQWCVLLKKYPEFKVYRDKVIDFLRTRTRSSKRDKITAHEFWERDLWHLVNWKKVAREKPGIVSVCFFHSIGDFYYFASRLQEWIREWPQLLHCVDWTNGRWTRDGLSKEAGRIIESCVINPRKEEKICMFLKELYKAPRNFFKCIQSAYYWKRLIIRDSYFIKFCHIAIDKLDIHWESAIIKNPSIISFCDLSKLTKKNWGKILDSQPQLLSYCKIINELDEPSVWSYRIALNEDLLSSVPETIKLDWEVILSYNPKIVTKCNKDMLNRMIPHSVWSRILCKQPQLFSVVKSCGALRKFDKYDWNDFIKVRPQFKKEYGKWYVTRCYRKLFLTACVLLVLSGIGYCIQIIARNIP
jgi:hypothetical protein